MCCLDKQADAFSQLGVTGMVRAGVSEVQLGVTPPDQWSADTKRRRIALHLRRETAENPRGRQLGCQPVNAVALIGLVDLLRATCRYVHVLGFSRGTVASRYQWSAGDG